MLLRGIIPLSGDPHVATGSTPGIAVIKVKEDGKTGVIKKIIRITNPDTNGVEQADAHGIRVRLK